MKMSSSFRSFCVCVCVLASYFDLFIIIYREEKIETSHFASEWGAHHRSEENVDGQASGTAKAYPLHLKRYLHVFSKTSSCRSHLCVVEFKGVTFANRIHSSPVSRT